MWPVMRPSAIVLCVIIFGVAAKSGVATAGDSAMHVVAAVPLAKRFEVTPFAQPTAACKVGRIAYCLKYKGVCENKSGNRDCQGWFDACVKCHATSDGCASLMLSTGPCRTDA